MFYDSGGDDDDELMYLPSSSGIHGTHCLSHKDPCERNGDVSPTRCFSRISKRSKMQSLMSRRASDQWKAQPITPLTDKAIASEFAKFTQVGTEHLGFDNYFAHFHDEDVGKIIKEPNTLTVVPKNDWNPRDIKMCSPFKACRGEASKVSKSGGPIYGSGFNNESGKPLETARPPLEGLFMVTADVDSDDDIESYERLYKAEFDLLVERGERVDLQEMDEWLYQAGLTGPQIKNHNNAFSSMLRLNCKYFGKRVYPYKGELDSMASKTLHVLNPHTNDFEAGPTIAIPDKHDLKKMKKRQLMDTESTAENSASDRIPGNSVAIATIPASTYRLFDCETQPRFIHDPSLKIGASNVRQLYKKETADGFIRCPSTGLRQAISDFQSVPSANEDSSGTIEASKPESPTSTKDKGGNPDASLMSQRNFILKILLRFPYLDLKQLGLTSF
ncbi:recombinase activating protein, putative [Babesia caballi]|uniref:Recombinase activating protein, putative n=1 Tax=Babesia caballi TaxID=5871 RepID=A0AAV4LZ50_BABCB|nr:recombinase activating protein, putative [Babesia caballi]